MLLRDSINLCTVNRLDRLENVNVVCVLVFSQIQYVLVFSQIQYVLVFSQIQYVLVFGQIQYTVPVPMCYCHYCGALWLCTASCSYKRAQEDTAAVLILIAKITFYAYQFCKMP